MKRTTAESKALQLKKDKIVMLTNQQMVSANGGTMQMTPVIFTAIYGTMWLYTKYHVGEAADATTKDK